MFNLELQARKTLKETTDDAFEYCGTLAGMNM